MRLLITGGCGFLGSNLAAHGISCGAKVSVFDNLSRPGASENLNWLQEIGRVEYIHGDIRNRNDVENLIRRGFDGIFHLAGQVAMTTSITDPYRDFETNTVGTVNLLEAVRKFCPQTPVFYSSTNKVYGDLEQYTYAETAERYMCLEYPNGYDERVPLDFCSPYGCSKGAADQYMLDYHRMFGLRTTVFRHSSMYGNRQFATYDQGWIGWFCRKALEKCREPDAQPFTISGNGKQVRDILHVRDMVSLYFSALENPDRVCGDAYNIGGTMAQSLSILELFGILEEMLGVRLEYERLAPRASDQKVFVADISKISGRIGWKPQVTAREGIAEMIEWVKEM